MTLCGIDYGSKLAGTTVITWLPTASQEVYLESSQKGQDADKFILQTLASIKPEYVFIDAPLSLPGVYSISTGNYQDYFFRQADKQLQAMSPMFLGGLTARAIKLKRELEAQQIKVYETYPAAQAARMGLPAVHYKKNVSAIPAYMDILKRLLAPLTLDNSAISNWHQVDALLALVGAVRFINNQHQVVGDASEGVIII
jgi:predicted nuclease with RNAse H fold